MNDRSEVFEASSIYRGYLIHEDMLINQRLQRMLIIQGFLFAAEATMLTKISDTLNSTQATTFVVRTFWLQIMFALLMAVTGLLAARFVYVALKSATEALKQLRVTWTADRESRANQYLLPMLTGGGSAYANKNGHMHVTHPAIWFGIVWSTFIVGLVSFAFIRHIL